jgi:hypothetical protein
MCKLNNIYDMRVHLLVVAAIATLYCILIGSRIDCWTEIMSVRRKKDRLIAALNTDRCS